MRTKRSQYIVGIVVAGAVLPALPQILSEYWTIVLTEVLIYGLFAAGLNIISGYAGLPSLGHAAFFGTGAYTTGIALLKLGVSQTQAFLIGIATVIVLALLLGSLAVRNRGTYFLMISLALAQCVWAIAWKWTSLTRGDDGLPGIPRPDLGLSWWSLSSTAGFYYFVLAFFALAVLAVYVITRSPFGQTLVGIRENELRMRSLGYNIWLHAYIGFVVSSFFSGLAGILFVWHKQFVNPDVLSIMLSTEGLLMVVLGGAGTLLGPIAGAATIVLVKHGSSALTIHWPLILGAIYIIIVIGAPEGIVRRLRKGYWS